ncbi:hypothetical protein [Sporosalibacterium faouarense]|uniref:hypothetical protein n=1 Tax=Sporosalibacterium faouarense TaxID=516123 RepID=UPI00141CAB76|nr:hypothetical protein [Sporosalibacterium faouarense]MTI46937.1 hypothetical protein [Bacillota bacterium]
MNKINNKKNEALESALWSVALPGLGQLLNKRYFKGFLFILLEFIINMKSNLNTIIIYSFYGNMSEAIEKVNYQWLMFYPCVYIFAIWDAYRDRLKENKPYLFIPFVSAAYIGTIAVIYSSTFELMGFKIGPIFLPIISISVTLVLGLLLRPILIRRVEKK